jgi:hypothetical protein
MSVMIWKVAQIMFCHVKLLLLVFGIYLLVGNYYGLQLSALQSSLCNEDTPAGLISETNSDVSFPIMIDYAAFWGAATNEAVANSKVLATPMTDGPWKGKTYSSGNSTNNVLCPKVYMYNLSSTFQDTNFTKLQDKSWVFGPSSHGWNGTLRQTRQHHLGVIFQNRLMQPGNCYATDDPNEADLFFVPLLLNGKKVSDWTSSCKTMDLSMLIPELPFLTEATACKHFFVFPKGHYAGENCKGWFFDPLPIFKSTMRISYSHLAGNVDESLVNYLGRSETPEIDNLRHPNLISVPYPSSLHWHANYTKPMPWKNTASQKMQRKYLMSYVGRFDHGDVPVRRQIQQQCEQYNDPIKCVIPTEDPVRASSMPSDDILIKEESVFCLEPGGDSPWRKSLSDSITFGCIPVLFSEDSDEVSPWHWGHWKKQGRILIDREAFVRGEIDLYQLLISIPPELLELMQQTLDQYAHQFQYSLHEDHNDGFHLTMDGMKRYSRNLKEQGQC